VFAAEYELAAHRKDSDFNLARMQRWDVLCEHLKDEKSLEFVDSIFCSCDAKKKKKTFRNKKN
jgi:hypothetical protein